jgi:hypothetical protein
MSVWQSLCSKDKHLLTYQYGTKHNLLCHLSAKNAGIHDELSTYKNTTFWMSIPAQLYDRLNNKLVSAIEAQRHALNIPGALQI